MKKILIFCAFALLALPQLRATILSYTVTSGQTIYYEIVDGEAHIVCPGTRGWGSYTQPTGDLRIPYGLPDASGVNKTVTEIGDFAFNWCSGLTKVTIPASVKSIGLDAFYRCSGLTEVSFVSRNNQLTRISGHAFEGCNGVTRITVPSGVTWVGASAFGDVFNVCYSGSATGAPWGALSLNGYPEPPFLYTDNTKTTLKKLVRLELSVEVASTVTTIADSAFMGKRFTEITFPESLQTIGRYAFANCTACPNITVPNGVSSIGSNAFLNVLNLVYQGSATGSPWGARYRNVYINSPWVYSSASQTEVVGYLGSDLNVTIPAGVTRVGNGTFKDNTTLETVTIGNQVTSVGNQAFANCTALRTVSTTSALRSIGDSAFYGCADLRTTYLYYGLESIGRYAFAGCQSMRQITLPNSVTTIGSYCFMGDMSLYQVTFPNTLTRLGQGAFMYCQMLGTLTLPSTLSTIEQSVFSYSGLDAITIPNSVTTIGGSAFAYCSGLTSITIPNSVTTIGMDAFAHCSRLTSVTFGNSVSTIGSEAFTYCTGLTSIALPNSLVSVSSSAFAHCTNLGSIDLGNSVQHIEYEAFMNTGLTSVVIPNSVTSLGSRAFGSCSNLTSMTVGNGVSTIPDDFCTGGELNTLHLGSSVTLIQSSAFGNQSRLTTVTCEAANPPTLQSGAFEMYYSTNVYVPCGRASVYRSSNWSNYFVSPSSSSGSWNINADMTYRITYRAQDANKGSVSCTQSASCSRPAILQATARTGYAFRCWADGNTQNPRSITLTRDTVMVAVFASSATAPVVTETVNDCHNKQLTLLANDATLGQCAGAGSYANGTAVQILAVPSAGAHFVRWGDGNTQNPRTVVVGSDVTMTAIFAQ